MSSVAGEWERSSGVRRSSATLEAPRFSAAALKLYRQFKLMVVQERNTFNGTKINYFWFFSRSDVTILCFRTRRVYATHRAWRTVK